MCVLHPGVLAGQIVAAAGAAGAVVAAVVVDAGLERVLAAVVDAGADVALVGAARRNRGRGRATVGRCLRAFESFARGCPRTVGAWPDIGGRRRAGGRRLPVGPINPGLIVGGRVNVDVFHERNDRHIDVAILLRGVLELVDEIVGRGLERGELV